MLAVSLYCRRAMRAPTGLCSFRLCGGMRLLRDVGAPSPTKFVRYFFINLTSVSFQGWWPLKTIGKYYCQRTQRYQCCPQLWNGAETPHPEQLIICVESFWGVGHVFAKQIMRLGLPSLPLFQKGLTKIKAFSRIFQFVQGLRGYVRWNNNRRHG